MDNKKIGLLLVSAIGLLTAFCWSQGWLQFLEDKSLDYRFLARGYEEPSPDVVVVTIDEASIERLGRFPWRRRVHAALITRLTELGARTIAFDVLFTEPDLDHPEDDLAFFKAGRTSQRLVLSSFFQTFRESDFTFHDPVLPTDVLAEGCAAVGFTNLVLSGKSGTVVRRIPLIAAQEEGIAPSLALATLSVFWERHPEDILFDEAIPLRNGEILLNYAGDEAVFPSYPYHRVLAGEAQPDAFRDKIVLIGATAAALFDLKDTPFSAACPGVFLHAETISNVLQRSYLRRWPEGVTLGLILGFSLFAGLLLARLRPLAGGVCAALVLISYIVLVQVLFSRHFYMELIAPALSLSISYSSILFFKLVVEEKEKRRIKGTFGKYLSPRVMEKVLYDPNSLQLGGQRQFLTVLFSDIRNFTTLSESLDSKEVVALLNEYLSKMVEVVFKHDGTLDKFIGDAVMAFWGAPVPQNDHARRAVLCGLEMLEELRRLQDKWKREGRPAFEIGIGINSGEMTVGNMGSNEKMEYTVIGDNVNLASRLEGLNKQHKTRMLVSEATYQTVRDIADAVPIGSVTVKGREQPVVAYSVIGNKTQPDPPPAQACAS